MKIQKVGLLLGLSFVGSSVMAVPVNVSGDSSLQDVLDEITVGGDSSIDVNEDQVSPSEYWAMTDTSMVPTRYVAAAAAMPDSISFGIYDQADSSNTYTIFDGDDEPGAATQFGLDGNGDVYSDFDTYTGVTFSSDLFGFFIQTEEYTFYSDASMNPYGAQQMVAYDGGNGDTINLPGFGGDVEWTSAAHLLGFEEDVYPYSDQDFSDMVVFLKSAVPVDVPEPGTLALLGMGLAGLGAARRRRRTV